MDGQKPYNKTGSVNLRDVLKDDIRIFFEHQSDPVANQMAAFTSKDFADREAFNARWERLMANNSIRKQTILFDGHVTGSIASFEMEGKREVTYWIGRDYWGKGIASTALAMFLNQEQTLPIYARVAKDNAGSIRVLKKCGFTVCGEEKGFALARGEEIEEYILILNAYK